MARPRVAPAVRFWRSVEKTDSCWLWTASVNWGGYGRFNDGETEVGAHRFAHELLIGPIPPDHHVDHLCKVRHCVNPAHLEAVTGRINTLRSDNFIAHNYRKTHCVRGHPLSGMNLYVCPRGKRECRTCRAEANARRRRRLIREEVI